MSLVLETHALAKRYGSLWALSGVDLEVRRGDVFGLLGPNGAGKTTFTKCITGFVRPNAGGAAILGIDPSRDPVSVARHVGLVPDQYDLYPSLTGRQHLDYYGRLQGMAASERAARIDEVLSLVGMVEHGGRRVKGYSHGMKQRICIGQAILHEPELIIFDEPTNGLDPKGAYELRQMMRDLAKDGATVILNSHLLHEVEQVCNRVAVLHRGKVLADSPVAELRRRFAGAARVDMTLLRPLKKHATAIERALGVTVEKRDNTLSFPGDGEEAAQAVAAVVAAGGQVVGLTTGEGSLEEAFLQLTAEDAA